MAEEQPGFFEELKQRKVYRVAIAYVVVAWVALQFFDLVLENVNAPDWVMQALMAILAVGLPVALVLAWAFDVSDDGIRLTPGWSRGFSALVAVVSIIAIVVVVRVFGGEEADGVEDARPVELAEIRAIDSIAVLPFESFSTDKSDEYFADGLADTLLHKLAQLPNLKVIARNSSFQFKGTNKDAREIGAILGVAGLLEGSVQRQGESVRVIAQLIDTVDGSHIWSGTFDDTMQNIFELQDRVAADIMLQLQISISEQDRLRVLRNGTDDPEAYDLLLRANEMRWEIDRKSFDPESDPLLDLVDRALAIDQNYAQAWSARSNIFSSALFFDNDPTRSLEFINEAREAAQKAIDANPEYADAYVSLAWSYIRERNHVEGERYLVKALELDPSNTDAMRGLGLIKVNGDPGMALDLFTRARELDPQSEFVYRQTYFALRALGRWDEGLEVLLDGVERFPENTILNADIAGLYRRVRGRPDEAARWASKVVEIDQQSQVGSLSMATAWLAAGNVDRASDWLDLYADRFVGAPSFSERTYAIEITRDNAQAARSAIEAVPESPNFRFDRSVRLGGACLVLGDTECMLEHAGRMRSWLDEFEARGQAYGPSLRYELAIAILRNAAIGDVAQRDDTRLRELLELTAEWPVTGGSKTRYVDYVRVMLQSLLGNDEAAVRELQATLKLDDDGLVYEDVFKMPPEKNPLIFRLSDQAGYAEWRTELEARRESARGRMLRMEQDGIILSPDKVVF